MIQTSDIVIFIYLRNKKSAISPNQVNTFTSRHAIIITIQFGTHQVKVLDVRQGFQRYLFRYLVKRVSIIHAQGSGGSAPTSCKIQIS